MASLRWPSRSYSSETLLTFEDALNIALAVQNPNDVDGVFSHEVVNPDGFNPATGQERRS